MVYAFPLTLIPFLLYNLFGFWAGNPWSSEILAIPMVGGLWTVTWGDLMLVLGLAMLFFETLKAARPANRAIANHLASTGVLIIYIIEFILVGIAASSTFFILLLIALFDVAAGFTISIRTASRDISFGRPDGGIA
jgi:hypothetical protein